MLSKATLSAVLLLFRQPLGPGTGTCFSPVMYIKKGQCLKATQKMMTYLSSTMGANYPYSCWSRLTILSCSCHLVSVANIPSHSYLLNPKHHPKKYSISVVDGWNQAGHMQKLVENSKSNCWGSRHSVAVLQFIFWVLSFTKFLKCCLSFCGVLTKS